MMDAKVNKMLYTLNRRVARLNDEIDLDAPKVIIDLEMSLIWESLTAISNLLENKSYIKE